MEIPAEQSTVIINGGKYSVLSPVMAVKIFKKGSDQEVFLANLFGVWYPLEFGWEIENFIGQKIIKNPTDHLNQIFVIEEQEYQVLENFVGFIVLNTIKPKYLVGIYNYVFVPLPGWDIKIKTQDILFKNMDNEMAFNYCHTYPSDDCRLNLVKKLFGPDSIKRKPKNMEVKDWVNLLMSFYQKEGIKMDVLNSLKNLSLDPLVKIRLFMVLTDAYLKNYLTAHPNYRPEQYKRQFELVITKLLETYDEDFIDWLISTGLIPNKIWMQPMIEAYQKSENKQQIINKIEKLGRMGIKIDQFDFFTGLNSELGPFSIELLEALEKMGLLDDNQLDIIVQTNDLKEKKRWTEINWLKQKGYRL